MRQMKLGVFLRSYGHHVAAWRHPHATDDSPREYLRFARTAEKGLFDLLFLADINTAFDEDSEVLSLSSWARRLDPFALVSALAFATEHIGLVCTTTTTYDQPYHVARRFASLDVISGGRAGWNLVTSRHPAEAMNFGSDPHASPGERYDRAHEFAHVVRGLWDSWDADALVRDKVTGRFFEPAKVHVLNHKGEHFSVRGPLTVPRSPQGQPVMVQAGSSEDGKELAAQTAEIVFTAQTSLKDAQAFYADLKGRLAQYGRQREDLKIMPGVFYVVGRTSDEAKAKYEQLQQLIEPRVGLMLLSAFMGYDVSQYPLDDLLPAVHEEARGSRPALLYKLSHEQNLTIRQLYMRMAGGRGHIQVFGTPAEIADSLEEWLMSDAADGFNIMPPLLPGDLDDFVDLVIPELQRRHLFRTCYEGSTLRENLGLRQPASRYSTPTPTTVNTGGF